MTNASRILWQGSVRLAPLVILPVIWVLFFVQYPLLRVPPVWYFAGAAMYVIALYRLLEPVSFPVVIALRDGVAFAVILAVSVVAHARGLTFSLGGDELYHAETASFHLRHLRTLVESWPVSSAADHPQSYWRLFDLRHAAVPDIALMLAASLWAVGFAWVAVYVRTRGRSRFRAVLVWSTMVALAAAGIRFGFPEGLAHPPLRLLPLFVSTIAGGLSNIVFRAPALLVSVGVSFFLYRSLRRELDGSYAWLLSVSFGLVSGFIPTVFYVAEAVEPSIYGWAAWVGCLVCIKRALDPAEHHPANWLAAAGAITGLASVMRQPVVVAWVAVITTVAIISWQRRLRLRPMLFLRIFASGAVAIPYFLTATRLGHAAVDHSSSSLLDRLQEAASNGAMVMTLINSTTLSWSIFILAVIPVAFARNGRLLLLLLSFTLPAWITYFSISSYLWGVGRYQAEYAAPAISFIFFFAFQNIVSPPLRIALAAAVVLLGASAMQSNYHVTADANYAQWPQMRISTTAYLPYGDALSFLRRADVRGEFAIIGGQPWYGDMPLWLSAHSFSETAVWRARQQAVQGIVNRSTDNGFESTCREIAASGVKWLAVQGGTRRERQHQQGGMRRFADQIADAWKSSPLILDRRSFIDAMGGTIDLYRLQ